MKKISIAIMALVVALASCKKTPEVNLKYVDVERDLITVGTTTATVQCDYDYIATLKKAYLCYGEGENEDNFSSAEMRVVQNTLYVDLSGLTANTTYNYYYEFHNGFNSMRTALKTFKTEGGSGPAIILPTVVTGEVTEITSSSAKGSGEVTNNGGAEVTERGVCWSTSENPTVDDNHVAAGTGTGAFTAMMNDLEANTTYHVRAYATNEVGTAYGLDREFVTNNGGGGCDCGYVDLGLPSGTLWATCNIGANSPEDYGGYFAWGETEPKDFYEWSTYQHCNGSFNTFTKYCSNSSYGYNGFADNLTILLPEDDAATVNLGSGWRMPTKDEWEELSNNTTSIWTNQNGINGRLFTSSNGNTLFLPAAGHRVNSEFYYLDVGGYYWTSNTLDPAFPLDACYFVLVNNSLDLSSIYRLYGFSVRAVRSEMGPPTPPDVPEGAINGLFTVNANGDQVYFSQGNLQYQASTNTWRFADDQFSFVGGVDYMTGEEWGNVYEGGSKCDNTLLSSSYNGWIDLFCWGTSGYHDSNDPYNIHYQPWATPLYYVSEFNSVGVGPSTNMPSPDLTGSSANYDWGVYNPIINGGNEANQWRTLSKDEWKYIMDVRNTVSGIRYAKCMVDGYESLVLLPDGWNSSLYELQNVNSFSASFGSNVITRLSWENVFESSGAVLLMATGVRNITEEYDVYYQRNGIENGGDLLSYWSTISGDADAVYTLFYTDYFGGADCQCFRGTGRSVRLVQDANPQK